MNDYDETREGEDAPYHWFEYVLMTAVLVLAVICKVSAMAQG